MALTDAAAHASFTAFVHDRSDRLHDVAWLVTRNSDDARDAVQDALAALYARWSTLPLGDELEAYTHRTVVNACLRVIRRRPRSLSVAEPEQLRSAPASGDETRPVDDADEVWRLCGDLTPEQRTALVLRFYADLTFAQVADAMGCREATARSHIHRAMTKLRARLAGGER